ncbi:MAG: N-acetylmuramoyl-L-alanine amidase [Pseudomonadota bacterium]
MRIQQTPSPNFDTRRDGALPSLIVLHQTENEDVVHCTDCYMGHKILEHGRISPHYLIGLDGVAWQFVADKNRAWHAGKSWWCGKEDVNSHSIGIEMLGARLSPFPAAQLDALRTLVNDLQCKWDIPAQGVLGHNDIAPDRKFDPGPLFPWRNMAVDGIGVWPEAAESICDADQVVPLLRQIGYTAPVQDAELVTGFQIHYVPEIWTDGTGQAGVACTLTRQRLFALHRKLCHT